MTADRVQYNPRKLLAIASAGVVWSSFVFLADGFTFQIGRTTTTTSTVDSKKSLIESSTAGRRTFLASSSVDTEDIKDVREPQKFDLTTALFCGGLAFDAYAEPPANSSRWERGSSGLNVAFQSQAFTRSLYRGLVEVTPIRCTDLPDEDDKAEELLSGKGVDASLLVAVAEGKWKEDVQIIEKERHHDGVYQLKGCAHVGQSTTAWSNINENKGKANAKKGLSGAYYIPSSWGKGGTAVWTETEPSFYLYVQEPETARLVFTVMDDDVVGDGSAVGSTSRKLSQIFPTLKEEDLIQKVKNKLMKEYSLEDLENGNIPPITQEDLLQEWSGVLKLTNKPRIKDKKGQMAMGAAAGAAVAGPVGAALGAAVGRFYEGEVRGSIEANLKYMPIPSSTNMKRNTYEVKGGLPGVNWGKLYEKYLDRGQQTDLLPPDLEFCFFITHDVTGCSCAVYRSLEQRSIAVSFRGTCELIDLVTDASILQTTWVEGEDIENPDVAKVHTGFRTSMDSISRRLKELLIAAVKPGEDISDYDVIVTGHSLGGALATLFTADIAEYGIDAGRGLPQTDASDAWWMFFRGADDKEKKSQPPRPKSLKMYNYGSPRVGNEAFVQRFDSLIQDKRIDEAYRIVNGADAVTRMPRTVNTLSIGYEHCGPTALITLEKDENDNLIDSDALVWVEGETDDQPCPVRDGTVLKGPLASGTLLGDIVSQLEEQKKDSGDKEKKLMDYVKDASQIANVMQGRLSKLTASDLTSIVGIDKNFVERESKIVQSILSGEALSHHMEDQYYLAMGRASGFNTVVGQDIEDLTK